MLPAGKIPHRVLQQLLIRRNCQACHSIELKAGLLGPRQHFDSIIYFVEVVGGPIDGAELSPTEDLQIGVVCV